MIDNLNLQNETRTTETWNSMLKVWVHHLSCFKAHSNLPGEGHNISVIAYNFYSLDHDHPCRTKIMPKSFYLFLKALNQVQNLKVS